MDSIDTLNQIFHEMGRQGRYADILEKLRIISTLDQLYTIYWSTYAYMNIGLIEDGLDYFKINEKVIENDERDQLKPQIWNNVGKLYYQSGQPLNAYGFFQKAFETAIKFNLNEEVNNALNNLGTVNVTRGNLDQALGSYQNCLDRAIHDEDIILQADTLYNIGNIHFLDRKLTEAKAHFVQCLQHRRLIGNKTKIALTLKSLIELEFGREPDLSQVTEYIEEMQSIANSENTDSIMLYYLYSKAIFAQYRNELNKSEGLYRKIISDNQEIDITIGAILRIIEILFIKYQTDQSEVLLQDIHHFLDQMFEISKSQFSFRYLVKSLILKSQLNAIEGKIEDSYILIEQALKATNDHKMDYLRKDVLRLKEKLGSEYDNLEESFKDNSSLLARIEKSSIMELLKE